MIDAGLPLVQCLEILASQQENKFFQKVLTSTRSQVEGGATLSAAMRGSPKVFDALYVNMVEAGETGGIFGTNFQQLWTPNRKKDKFPRPLKAPPLFSACRLTRAAGVLPPLPR